MYVDHRGFSLIADTLDVVTLDATPYSDLKWDVIPQKPILWELEWGELNLRNLPSFQIAMRIFNETIWKSHKEKTLGLILYRGGVPDFKIELLADMLHQLGALLPDEVPPFALFDLEASGSYYTQLFSKELFSHIHLGFRSASFGALSWIGDEIKPLRHDAKLGIALPLRSKVAQDTTIDICLETLQLNAIPYRLITEMYLTEEWDELDHLIVFSSFLSPQGLRKVKGFEAAGGTIVVVGEKLGGEREISMKDFLKDRGRGIRTPDLLLPKQTR